MERVADEELQTPISVHAACGYWMKTCNINVATLFFLHKEPTLGIFASVRVEENGASGGGVLESSVILTLSRIAILLCARGYYGMIVIEMYPSVHGFLK